MENNWEFNSLNYILKFMIMKTDHLWIFYNSHYADFCHRDNVGKLLEFNTTIKLVKNQ